MTPFWAIYENFGSLTISRVAAHEKDGEINFLVAESALHIAEDLGNSTNFNRIR